MLAIGMTTSREIYPLELFNISFLQDESCISPEGQITVTVTVVAISMYKTATYSATKHGLLKHIRRWTTAS